MANKSEGEGTVITMGIIKVKFDLLISFSLAGHYLYNGNAFLIEVTGRFVEEGKSKNDNKLVSFTLNVCEWIALLNN
ncbi:hypothetical protein [Neobacillus massiliamazoniensis]|uniref:Uncharacterized protein n=1 Tax=Neobacillus massiliamazoniensis TaxID=1499688 RepID=A0A0U1NZI0_9BACI|nr:hypothetical protein [Neobacillus massiliamazoniensis]CRK83397.1 hypothetical protein BN000_03365 [Neobacillus massiliamazoniensis]